jgi:hypothetical protein
MRKDGVAYSAITGSQVLQRSKPMAVVSTNQPPRNIRRDVQQADGVLDRHRTDGKALVFPVPHHRMQQSSENRVKGKPAVPAGLLTSKPTWSNTAGAFGHVGFFALRDAVAWEDRHGLGV